MKKLIVLTTAVMFIAVVKAQSDDHSVGADLIVFNAKITTESLSQPEASALAVKRGRIYAVGTDAEILSLKDRDPFCFVSLHCRQVVRPPKISDVRRDELDRRGIAIELRARLGERHCRDEQDGDRKSDSSWHFGFRFFPIF